MRPQAALDQHSKCSEATVLTSAMQMRTSRKNRQSLSLMMISHGPRPEVRWTPPILVSVRVHQFKLNSTSLHPKHHDPPRDVVLWFERASSKACRLVVINVSNPPIFHQVDGLPQSIGTQCEQPSSEKHIVCHCYGHQPFALGSWSTFPAVPPPPPVSHTAPLEMVWSHRLCRCH